MSGSPNADVADNIPEGTPEQWWNTHSSETLYSPYTAVEASPFLNQYLPWS